MDCWFRFDQSYSSPVSANSTQLTPFEDADSSILGMPSTVHDPLWYLDSGATHHLTHDTQNLAQKCSYTSKDSVKHGNGSGISISSSSTGFIAPYTQSPLILHDLLYVPSIMKNLLSVSKFVQDTHVFFEFHADRCHVKSKNTN